MEDNIVEIVMNMHHFNQDLMKQNIMYCEEIERLHSIIKEARELVKNGCCLDDNSKCVDDLIYWQCDELLEILDKENKE